MGEEVVSRAGLQKEVSPELAVPSVMIRPQNTIKVRIIFSYPLLANGFAFRCWAAGSLILQRGVGEQQHAPIDVILSDGQHATPHLHHART